MKVMLGSAYLLKRCLHSPLMIKRKNEVKEYVGLKRLAILQILSIKAANLIM